MCVTNFWHLLYCHFICVSKLSHLIDSLLPPELCYFWLCCPIYTIEPYQNHGVGLRLTTLLDL